MKRRSFLGAALLLAGGSRCRAARGWTKLSGTAAGLVTVAGRSLIVQGRGAAPHWGAWTEALSLVYDPVLGQQPGTWSMTFADGTLFGTTGLKYLLAGETNWALVVRGGTGEYAGAAGWVYWYGAFAPGGGPYTAEVYGYVSLSH